MIAWQALLLETELVLLWEASRYTGVHLNSAMVL